MYRIYSKRYMSMQVLCNVLFTFFTFIFNIFVTNESMYIVITEKTHQVSEKMKPFKSPCNCLWWLFLTFLRLLYPKDFRNFLHILHGQLCGRGGPLFSIVFKNIFRLVAFFRSLDSFPQRFDPMVLTASKPNFF